MDTCEFELTLTDLTIYKIICTRLEMDYLIDLIGQEKIYEIVEL